MPYIEQSRRDLFDPQVNEVIRTILNADDVLRCGYRAVDMLIRALWAGTRSYTHGNMLVGVLYCVGLEFNRRRRQGDRLEGILVEYTPEYDFAAVIPETPKDFPIITAVGDLMGLLYTHDYKPGDLNYCLTRICWALFNNEQSTGRLQDIDLLIINAADKFYEAELALYEDKKIEEHGDLAELLPKPI